MWLAFACPIDATDSTSDCFRPQPAEYELKSKKKGWMRFWTPFIKEKLQELTLAQQQLDEAQKDQVSPQSPEMASGRAILETANRV